MWIEFRSSRVETRLRNANNAQLASLNAEAAMARKDAAQAERDLAQANQRAAEANERAKRAEEHAAQANSVAEQERLARVKIEERIAARHLTGDEEQEVATKLRRFAGQKINLVAYAGDAEAIAIATQIGETLQRARWVVNASVVQEYSRAVAGILVEVGPGADKSSLGAANSLVSALSKERLATVGPQQLADVSGGSSGSVDPTAKIKITVGKKP